MAKVTASTASRRLQTPSRMKMKEWECSAPPWSWAWTVPAIPRKGTICPVKMMSPIPVTNPVMTACGIASIRMPMREIAIATRTSPASSVADNSPS